jgi:hypothetical protein
VFYGTPLGSLKGSKQKFKTPKMNEKSITYNIGDIFSWPTIIEILFGIPPLFKMVLENSPKLAMK